MHLPTLFPNKIVIVRIICCYVFICSHPITHSMPSCNNSAAVLDYYVSLSVVCEDTQSIHIDNLLCGFEDQSSSLAKSH